MYFEIWKYIYFWGARSLLSLVHINDKYVIFIFCRYIWGDCPQIANKWDNIIIWNALRMQSELLECTSNIQECTTNFHSNGIRAHSASSVTGYQGGGVTCGASYLRNYVMFMRKYIVLWWGSRKSFWTRIHIGHKFYQQGLYWKWLIFLMSVCFDLGTRNNRTSVILHVTYEIH